MDWTREIVNIHFASPFFMAGAAAFFFVLYVFFARRGKSKISHPYISFFQKDLVYKKTFNPLLGIYRTLPFLIALGLVLMAGNPVHEARETRASTRALYSILLDSSGSLTAYNESGQPSLTLQDSMWNIARLGVMQFADEEKDTSEFFLMLYSDTPYAARYFAGGKEAVVQIGEFLETLPEEVRRWQGTSRAFYLQGTSTSFALEAFMRYRESWPKDLRAGSLILITDLEDTDITRAARILDTLAESDALERTFVIVLSSIGDDRNIASFERSLKHRERVVILRAHDTASFEAAFGSIRSESSSQDVTTRVLESKSLLLPILMAVMSLTFVFIGLAELYVRRVP